MAFPAFGAETVAQLVGSLPSMHKVLGLIPTLPKVPEVKILTRVKVVIPQFCLSVTSRATPRSDAPVECALQEDRALC